MSLVRTVNLSVHSPAIGSAMSPIAWKSVIRSSGISIGSMFFDAKAFPTISFKSTKVTPTGPATAEVTGDFTLHGVTRPVTLAATFNGGWAANAFDGNRVGFSAKGMLKRSDFGMTNGIPAPGTTMGVSDAVEFAIEAEFSNGTKTAAAKP